MSGTQLVRYESARTALAAYEGAAAPSTDGPGCYVMRRGARVLYVGESVDVARRLAGHDWRVLIRSGATVVCVPCANHKEVEGWLIEGLNPLLNGKSRASRIQQRRAAKKTRSSGSTPDQRASQVWAELFGESPFWSKA